LDGAFWLTSSIILLLYLQRRFHEEIVTTLYLATLQLNLSLTIFSIIFFPGVLVHEVSHWLMARVLGVKTGGMSLIPERLPDGSLRMGYVETGRTDILRDALIGLAPLLAGSLLVAYAGFARLRLHLLWGGLLSRDAGLFAAVLKAVYAQPDFWLWLYLIVAVSSMMLPSRSDRRAWRPVLLFLGLFFGAALAIGAGPWMVGTAAPKINDWLRALSGVFWVSVLVHLVLLPPVIVLRGLFKNLRN